MFSSTLSTNSFQKVLSRSLNTHWGLELRTDAIPAVKSSESTEQSEYGVIPEIVPATGNPETLPIEKEET